MDWDWFYGLNILGDPTLKPKNQTCLRIVQKKSHPQYNFSSWNPPEIIASDPESDGFPTISANTDGKIWVVWESGRSTINGRSEIYSANHTAGGWSNGTEVGPFYYWDYGPAIGTRSGMPVAVWAGWENLNGNYQYDLFYSVYNGSWSARQPVHSLDPASDMNPDLARDNMNNLWICWESRRNVNIDIYASYFNGSAWSVPQRVTSDAGDETSPEIIKDNTGALWIFYCRRTMDRAEICGCYYNGSQWLPAAIISGSQKMAYQPSAAVDANGRVWVVWHGHDTGDPEIFSSYYNGAQWSFPRPATSNAVSDLFPDITADTSGILWLVYQTRTDQDWDIYSMRLIDTVWANMDTVASLAGPEVHPRITCSNMNELWVCWQGYLNGNWEILSTNKNATAIAETTPSHPHRMPAALYPSISAHGVTIKTSQPYQRIRIYNITGQLAGEITSDASGIASWGTDNTPAGSYFIYLQEPLDRFIHKVVIIK
jgi:hypothetical protein